MGSVEKQSDIMIHCHSVARQYLISVWPSVFCAPSCALWGFTAALLSVLDLGRRNSFFPLLFFPASLDFYSVHNLRCICPSVTVCQLPLLPSASGWFILCTMGGFLTMFSKKVNYFDPTQLSMSPAKRRKSSPFSWQITLGRNRWLAWVLKVLRTGVACLKTWTMRKEDAFRAYLAQSNGSRVERGRRRLDRD